MCYRLLRVAVTATLIVGCPLAMAGDGFGIAEVMSKLVGDAKTGGETLRAWAAYKSGDKDAPAQIFALAKNGNAVAQNLAGYMLDNGEGVKKDSKAAAAYFSAASKQSAIAKYNLGLLYLLGRGVGKDENKAMLLFREALPEASIEQAAVRLSLYHLKKGERQTAWKYANEAANRGNYTGFYLVGRMLYEDKNYKDAYSWLSKAAAAGESNSPALLSNIYAGGLGTDRNKAMAGGWWLIYLSGNRGSANANFSSLSAFDLDEDQVQKATKFAQNWLATHRSAERVNYDQTIYEVRGRGM